MRREMMKAGRSRAMGRSSVPGPRGSGGSFDLASTVRLTVLHNSATNDKLIARHSVLEMHQYHLGHGIHSSGAEQCQTRGCDDIKYWR